MSIKTGQAVILAGNPEPSLLDSHRIPTPSVTLHARRNTHEKADFDGQPAVDLPVCSGRIPESGGFPSPDQKHRISGRTEALASPLAPRSRLLLRLGQCGTEIRNQRGTQRSAGQPAVFACSGMGQGKILL